MFVVARCVLCDHSLATHSEVIQEKIVKAILDEAFYNRRTIGPGMLETVYKSCLAYRLRKSNFFIEVEKPIPVVFEEVRLECGYRADLVIENSVVVETKSIETIGPIQVAQLLTYLQFLNLRHRVKYNSASKAGYKKQKPYTSKASKFYIPYSNF